MVTIAIPSSMDRSVKALMAPLWHLLLALIERPRGGMKRLTEVSGPSLYTSRGGHYGALSRALPQCKEFRTADGLATGDQRLSSGKVAPFAERVERASAAFDRGKSAAIRRFRG